MHRRVSRVALFILIAAFALRLYCLEAVRYRYDDGYPLGQGISIVEAIMDGHLTELPILGLRSGILIPNPSGASYLWAVVALLDRSPYIALALSSMLNVLAVAMVYSLGRHYMGEAGALVAMALAAGASWAIVVARGTWLQGQLEFGAVTALWLILPALQRHLPRRLLSGFLVVALVSQTYLASFAIMAQTFIAVGLGRVWTTKLRRMALWGVAIYALSISGFLIALNVTHVDLSHRLSMGVTAHTPAPVPGTPAHQVDLSALAFAAQLATGHGFVQSWLQGVPDGGGLLRWFDNTRSDILALLLALGVALAAWRSRRNVCERIVLGWFLAPILSIIVLQYGFLHLALDYHYLLITSPSAYLLAALPIQWIYQRLHRAHWARYTRQIGRASYAVLLTGIVIVPAFDLYSYYQVSLTQPVSGGIDLMPLRDQLQFAQLWRTQCSEVSATFYPFEDRQTDWRFWTGSLLGGVRHVYGDSVATVDRADAWEISSEGGSCYTTLGSGPPFSHADAFTQRLPSGEVVTTFRSRKLVPNPVDSIFSVNLGWTLVDLQFPTLVHAGEWVTLTQAWRIDSLPDEPHALWRFDPFVRLVSSSDKVVVSADGVSIPGRAWQTGRIIVSDVRFQIPDNISRGNYLLSASLYDRVQRKNAVYIDTRHPMNSTLDVEQAVNVK